MEEVKSTATTFVKAHKQAAKRAALQSLKDRFDYGLNPEKLGGQAKLSDLGNLLAQHPKARKNPHFQDRIRATVYEHPQQYISCGNGVYELSSAHRCGQDNDRLKNKNNCSQMGGSKMENRYMKAQCRNMISVIAVFSQACELAALEDDGVRSKTEERELRKIRAAAERFRGKLVRVMK